MTKESTLDKAARMAMESVVQEIKMTDKYAKLQDHVGKYVAVPLHDIRIEDNVRQTVNFESTRFEELVDSIRAHGLLQNPVVELRVEEGIHILNCVAGQRRILAAIKAGLKTGTCLIQTYTNKADRISSGLVENLMREDLHCLDIAEGYGQLAKHGWSEEMIADRFEREKRTIHRYLKIAEWPPDVRATIRANPERFTSKVLFNEFVSRSFNSEGELLEAIHGKVTATPKTSATIKPSPKIKQAQAELKSKYGTRVSVKGNGEKGQISLNYKSPEDFARIIELLTD